MWICWVFIVVKGGSWGFFSGKVIVWFRGFVCTFYVLSILLGVVVEGCLVKIGEGNFMEEVFLEVIN